MIKKLIVDHIINNVPDSEVAVLLSGGVDSISVALAAHHAGKKVHAYSFYIKAFEYYAKKDCPKKLVIMGGKSYDFKTAEKFAKKMNWNFTPIEIPTENLVADWYRLVDLKCKKKTHFECVFPFLYVYPVIKEKYVLTGWGADGYFGVSKKAQMRYSSKEANEKYHKYFEKNPQNIHTFNEARDIYFLPDNSAGLKWHNKLVKQYNKVHVTPYLDTKVKDYFYQFSWEELNIPEQKHHVRSSYDEFSLLKVKKHENLHLGAGVNKLFETLLNKDEINFNNRKKMQYVCWDWKSKNEI